jgi:hypothetical protein
MMHSTKYLVLSHGNRCFLKFACEKVQYHKYSRAPAKKADDGNWEMLLP